MDGKSKISHNSPQPTGCVFTTATHARRARSILTHAATPQAERSDATCIKTSTRLGCGFNFLFSFSYQKGLKKMSVYAKI